MRVLASVICVLVICQTNTFFLEPNVEETDIVFEDKGCKDCKGFMNDTGYYLMSTETQSIIKEYTGYYCEYIENEVVNRYCSLVVEEITVKVMQSFVDMFASDYTCSVLTFCPQVPPPGILDNADHKSDN